MRFSLLLELQISDPTAATERQAVHEAVEQAVAADALGYHCVWAVEHHGLYEYSHCSAPETLLSFIAARTKRIRLGHGVTLTPFRYNHPIRIAERVAMLDIVSEGRVNWGSGKSTSLTERNAFEIEREELEPQWREALEMIPRMWRSDVFEWKGKYFQIPPTAIIPKPVQSPHPPIYIACTKPDALVTAGQLGAGVLSFAFPTEAYLADAMRTYRDAMEKAIADRTVSPRRANKTFCCTPNALVLDDDRRACEYGFRGARFFREGIGMYFFSPHPIVGALEIARAPLTEAELRTAMAERDGGSQVLAVIGDPAAARRAVGRFAAAGVDELILVMQMGTVPHAIVMESIHTFAEKVMPAFS